MKILRIAAAGAVLAAAIAAPASAADEARVRVLHASPDAPNVDVHLDGALVDALADVPFGTISDYLTIPAGSHQVQVYATGTTDSPVIDAELDFETGSATTVAATNAVAEIEAQVLVDAPAADADGAQVRVVHFSADAPAIDVAPDGADPADAIVRNLAYPNPTDYLVVPADTYDLEVRLAGEPTVALQLDPVDVGGGVAIEPSDDGTAMASAATTTRRPLSPTAGSATEPMANTEYAIPASTSTGWSATVGSPARRTSRS